MKKQLLEKCIETHGTDLYTFCRNLTRNEQDADDLYQDTFFTIMDKGKELHLEDNPKSYLLGIAIRLWKNRKRKFAWRQRIVPQCSYEEQQELHMQEFEKSRGHSFKQRERCKNAGSDFPITEQVPTCNLFILHGGIVKTVEW